MSLFSGSTLDQISYSPQPQSHPNSYPRPLSHSSSHPQSYPHSHSHPYSPPRSYPSPPMTRPNSQQSHSEDQGRTHSPSASVSPRSSPKQPRRGNNVARQPTPTPLSPQSTTKRSRSDEHLTPQPNSTFLSASPRSPQSSRRPSPASTATAHGNGSEQTARLSGASQFEISPYDTQHASASAASSKGEAVTKSRPLSGSRPLVSCEPCKKAHLKCSDQRPCERCVRTGKQHECRDVIHKERGRPPKNPKKIEERQEKAKIREERTRAGEEEAAMSRRPQDVRQNRLSELPHNQYVPHDLHQNASPPHYGPTPPDHPPSSRPPYDGSSYGPPRVTIPAYTSHGMPTGQQQQQPYQFPNLPALPGYPLPPSISPSSQSYTPGLGSILLQRNQGSGEQGTYPRSQETYGQSHQRRATTANTDGSEFRANSHSDRPTQINDVRPLFSGVEHDPLRLPPLVSSSAWRPVSSEWTSEHPFQSRPAPSRIHTGLWPPVLHTSQRQETTESPVAAQPTEPQVRQRIEAPSQHHRYSGQFYQAQTTPAYDHLQIPPSTQARYRTTPASPFAREIPSAPNTRSLHPPAGPAPGPPSPLRTQPNSASPQSTSTPNPLSSSFQQQNNVNSVARSVRQRSDDPPSSASASGREDTSTTGHKQSGTGAGRVEKKRRKIELKDIVD